MTSAAFFVRGTPVPQGSMRAFVNKRTGVPVIVHSRGAALNLWRSAVEAAAREAFLGRTVVRGGAWSCTVEFRLPRPKSTPRTRPWPTVARNDLDKLARAVLDALTGAVWEDDGQVVDMHCTKVYVDAGSELVGVRVEVRGL